MRSKNLVGVADQLTSVTHVYHWHTKCLSFPLIVWMRFCFLLFRLVGNRNQYHLHASLLLWTFIRSNSWNLVRDPDCKAYCGSKNKIGMISFAGENNLLYGRCSDQLTSATCPHWLTKFLDHFTDIFVFFASIFQKWTVILTSVSTPTYKTRQVPWNLVFSRFTQRIRANFISVPR